MNRRSPLVAPPRLAQGGAAARPFGVGAPSMGNAMSGAAEDVARQVADNQRGRFTERIYVFPQFAGLAPGGPSSATSVQSQTIEVTSNRCPFVRLVACRGILQASDTLPLTGLETANLLLSLSINGEEDLTTQGTTGGPASFASLFSSSAAPWLWFAAPPRLRNGDTVQATVTNNFAEGPTLTPEIVLRLVDDEWWQALYGT